MGQWSYSPTHLRASTSSTASGLFLNRGVNSRHSQPALEPVHGDGARLGREVMIPGVPDILNALRKSTHPIHLVHRGAIFFLHGTPLARRLSDPERPGCD